eukprot:s6720_g3.t1
MVHLSFNLSVTAPDDASDFDEEQDPGVPEALPLRHTWVVWQQLASPGKTVPYEQSTKQIASVSSVEDFWPVFDRLPQPSDLLTRRMTETTQEDGSHVVDALMIFRDGVLPQWEDAANSEGGHLQFHFKASLGAAQLVGAPDRGTFSCSTVCPVTRCFAGPLKTASNAVAATMSHHIPASPLTVPDSPSHGTSDGERTPIAFVPAAQAAAPDDACPLCLEQVSSGTSGTSAAHDFPCCRTAVHLGSAWWNASTTTATAPPAAAR